MTREEQKKEIIEKAQKFLAFKKANPALSTTELCQKLNIEPKIYYRALAAFKKYGLSQDELPETSRIKRAYKKRQPQSFDIPIAKSPEGKLIIVTGSINDTLTFVRGFINE